MQMLVNFIEALIISCVIIYTTYGLALLAMRSVWWTVRFASWVIVCAAFGVTLLVARAVWWMARRVTRFSLGVNDIHLSCGGSTAAISHSAVGHEVNGTPAPARPSFPDVAISVKEASEVLFAYERRVFGARSEIRKTVTRTLETIAQTRALMARVDSECRGAVRS